MSSRLGQSMIPVTDVLVDVSRLGEDGPRSQQLITKVCPPGLPSPKGEMSSNVLHVLQFRAKYYTCY